MRLPRLPSPLKQVGVTGAQAEQGLCTSPDSALPSGEMLGERYIPLSCLCGSSTRFAGKMKLSELNHLNLGRSKTGKQPGAQVRALDPPRGQMRVDCPTRLGNATCDPCCGLYTLSHNAARQDYMHRCILGPESSF